MLLVTTLEFLDLFPRLTLILRERAGKLDVGGGVEIPLLIRLATCGIPCPFSRKIWPGWVVSGILKRTEPVTVGTCASPPSTAVVTGIATLV